MTAQPKEMITMNEIETLVSTIPPFIPIKKWPKYFGFPSVGTLRYVLTRRKENGFAHCVKKVNGRVLLDTEAVLTWIKEQSDV